MARGGTLASCVLAAAVVCTTSAYAGTATVAAAPEMVVTGKSDEHKSCSELYNEFRALYEQTYSRQPSVWDSSVDTVAAAVGTVFPPAYLVWGLSTVEGFIGHRREASVQSRMAALRDVSARKQCFVN